MKNRLIWKAPDAGEGGRRKGQQRMRWLNGITNSWTWVWVNPRSWWWTGKPSMLQSMGSQRVGHDWTTELNWTELKMLLAWTSMYIWEKGYRVWSYLFKAAHLISGTSVEPMSILRICDYMKLDISPKNCGLTTDTWGKNIANY